MKTRKVTLRKYAREEKATAKNYQKRGFNEQAKDERKHARFFRNKLNN